MEESASDAAQRRLSQRGNRFAIGLGFDEVTPELAARDHLANVGGVVLEAWAFTHAPEGAVCRGAVRGGRHRHSPAAWIGGDETPLQFCHLGRSTSKRAAVDV